MITSQNPAFTGCGELRSCLVSQYKDNAKRRGIPFDLSVKYLWEIFEKQEKKCVLTGLPICIDFSIKRIKAYVVYCYIYGFCFRRSSYV